MERMYIIGTIPHHWITSPQQISALEQINWTTGRRLKTSNHG